jgi:hypothetical protein
MTTNDFMNRYNHAQVIQMSGHKNLRVLEKYSNFVDSEILQKNIEKKTN